MMKYFLKKCAGWINRRPRLKFRLKYFLYAHPNLYGIVVKLKNAHGLGMRHGGSMRYKQSDSAISFPSYWRVKKRQWNRFVEGRYRKLSEHSGSLTGQSKKRLVIYVTFDKGKKLKVEDYIKDIFHAFGDKFNLLIAGDFADQELRTTDKRLIASSVYDLRKHVEADDLVLFVNCGDKIHDGLPQILNCYNSYDKEFSLFDFYVTKDETVFPILLHGVDSVNGVCCDYFYSRFIIRDGSLVKILEQSKCNNPYEIVKQLFLMPGYSDLEGDKRVSLIDFPLLCASENTVKVDEIRRKLLKGKFEFSRNCDARANKGIVSVVICTKNNSHGLEALVESLLPERAVKEIIIVSNDTDYDYGLEFLDSVSRDPRIKIVNFEGRFNFSKQSNLGAQNATGKYLLFLNDDICGFSKNWLRRMIATAREFSDCIVGPLLLYPNQTIQHAGMYLGHEDYAGHMYRGRDVASKDLGFLLLVPRRVSCVTGAALMISRETFSNMNGFDPLLGSHLQDVDLCIRASDMGIKIVLEPRATLFHLESVSFVQTPYDITSCRLRCMEDEYFMKKWGERVARPDRWINPLINVRDETFRSLLVRE